MLEKVEFDTRVPTGRITYQIVNEALAANLHIDVPDTRLESP